MRTVSPRFNGAGANDYDHRIRMRVPGYDLLHTLTAAEALRRLPAQAQILVVGAGSGEEIVRLASLAPHWHFTATDISADMLALAQDKCARAGITRRVTFHHGGLDTLPRWHRYP